MSYPLLASAQLSTHLKSLRRAKGWSQAELGRQLGLSQVRIARIEKNPGLVSVDQLLCILQRLDSRLALLPPTPAGPSITPPTLPAW
jgi:HTH-type transcriptional regulator/antitoxin HipB